MRTLKKSLALVLVLAMVFSLAITASADYTDADEIAYPGAVELLTALGVMEGYPDGSFGAKNTLNRAEAAVMVARLNAFFDTTPVTPTYTDMAGYNWANWAVAYAENQGIVNGVAEGLYEPGTTLTGYMWVKMVLVSMGYDAEENGMTGAAWQIGVAALDKTVGVSGGLIDLSKEITREEAALCAYNALLASRDGQTWAVYHWTVEELDHWHYFNNEVDALAFALSVGADIEEDVFSGEVVTTLGFEKHGLLGYGIGYSQWGDPYFGWKTVTGFITKDWLEPAVTVDTAVTPGELYDLAMEAGLPYEDDKNTTENYLELAVVFLNGEPEEGYNAYMGWYDYVVPFTGNGTVTKLYNAGAAGIIAVAVEQFIGEVVADVPANTIYGADPYVVIANLCDDNDTDTETYPLFNYDADLGDIVLYNVCAGEIVGIHAPNTVTGTVQQIDMANTVDQEYDDVYTISGENYSLSRHEAVNAISGGETSVWYVDDCGNLMMKAASVPFQYNIGFLVEYDAQNYYPGDKMHTCEPYEASETFVIYDPATMTEVTYAGALSVDKVGFTHFVAGGTAAPTSNTTGDTYDLKATKYDVDNDAGLSLGLVVYLVNEDGEIYYISDTQSYDGSLVIKTNTNWELTVDNNDVFLYQNGEQTDKWMNDSTTYLYASLELAHEVYEQRTGLKNASDESAVGEYVYNAQTKQVITVAQYNVTEEPTPEDKTTVEDVLVYVGEDISITEKDYYVVDEYNQVTSMTEYEVTGLYVDGVSAGTVVFKEADPQVMPFCFFKGKLYDVSITTVTDGTTGAVKSVTWALNGVVEEKIETITYIGSDEDGDNEYFLTDKGNQYHLVADANIVCLNKVLKTVEAVETISNVDCTKGNIVTAYVITNDAGLVTDLYYVVEIADMTW